MPCPRKSHPKKVTPDSQIPFYVAKDVIVDGKVIFAKNAKGYLIVFDAYKVKRCDYFEYCKGGYIEIEDGFVQELNGNMREINYKERYEGNDCQPTSSTTTIYVVDTTSNTLTTNGGIASNVTLPKDQRFRINLKNEFKIDIKNIQGN